MDAALITEDSISADEQKLYDRQIRLWGLDAQKRLRSSRILLVGLGGLGAEVAKNVILTGVKSITLMDDVTLTQENSVATFLAPKDKLGSNRAEVSLERAQGLNPNVVVIADPGPLDKKPDSFFINFDVVCLTDCSIEQILRVNHICRENKIKFFAADVFGFFGFVFEDLLKHEYAREVPANMGPASKKPKYDIEMKTVKKISEFVAFKDIWELDLTHEELAPMAKGIHPLYFLIHSLLSFRKLEKRKPHPSTKEGDGKKIQDLIGEFVNKSNLKLSKLPENFEQKVFGELSPVCAVVGGVLAQEAIKASSHKDTPHNNFFLFDGLQCLGIVEKIFPPEP
ncbi:unnamed protein product [Darwinula stevensoni]|uniref:SUMO-activating enzyme subunit 1 n=1 Tax=Darwinula stevensoni TaxID=69355 RepID=A0A7R9ADZ8_9CRUS|nr:unnamed protein product [Darwinula stevensoni]CAG0901844.1 unnamed protein product [Darwinula stevensoni]